jgi:plastocyanin
MTRLGLRASLLPLGFALLVPAVGLADSQSRATKQTRAVAIQHVTVKGSEFKFVLSKKTIKTGVVQFRFTNVGKLPHDFEIDKVKTKTIGPGQTAAINVAFRKAGSYTYLCTVSGHAALGMKGVLKAAGKRYTGPAPKQPGAKPAKAVAIQKVTVKGSEFKFVLSKKTVKTGVVQFAFTNVGKLPHDFQINKVKTKVLGPGASQTINVAFRKAGSYTYLCTVTGHAALGMKGVLKATGKAYTGPVPKVPVAKKPVSTPAPTTPPANAQNTTVTVQMGDYFFQPNTLTAPVGTVTFHLVNVGGTDHDMYVESGINKGSADIDMGLSSNFSVTFTKPGTYQFICDIGEHAIRGMTGSITITS